MSEPKSDDLDILDDPQREEPQQETSQLWVISYSDFMTIMMIFFLMLFAHRVWSKNAAWETERIHRLKQANEARKGMVERLARLASTEVQAQRINIHLPDALLFDSGQVELRADARRLLGALAPELAGFRGQIIVEGHTDNRPVSPRSAYRSNWELSVARSFSVITFLTENGVNPQHISARGYGPYRPRAPNDTPESRAENRRIEIVLLNPPEEEL